MPKNKPQLPKSRVAKLAESNLFPVFECAYPYRGPNGEDRAVKLRFRLLDMATGKPPEDGRDTKTFEVKHKRGNYWRSGIGPYARTAIYNLPTATKAKAHGRTIYYTEGEKDASNAQRHWNVCAVAHYQGGTGATPEQARLLAGSRSRIVLVRDMDLVGAYVAWQNARALLAAGQPADKITFARPALDFPKADLSDHIEKGLGAKDLVEERPLEVAKLYDAYMELRAKSGRRRWMGSDAR
ncbi:toprim domain-containing protein [Actinomadura formosensis]|uniref:toprim domain-containing protein n=1 Tax=Actinomadura formosensis TaxID=60706 RepID=UPI000836C436|nr:hypothetical protein [Actinomadura formosensis]